jgi:hypothetical protein
VVASGAPHLRLVAATRRVRRRAAGIGSREQCGREGVLAGSIQAKFLAGSIQAKFLVGSTVEALDHSAAALAKLLDAGQAPR